MSKTFTQSQWGRVNGVSMAAAGCGPCSLAAIVYNLIMSITPKKTAEWLAEHGYFSSDGTTRTGMTAALNHYGFDTVYYKPEHQGGATWRAAMEKMKNAKGDWWAIFLAVGKRNGAKDNLWTNGGHFLAITDYRNGKLYVRDSGARGRTGYYDPETLRYDTNCIWFITKKTAAHTYTGTFPAMPAKGYLKQGDTGEAVKNLELFMQWYGTYKDKIDAKYGPKLKAAVLAFQKEQKMKDKDGIYGPATHALAKTIKK